MKRYDSNLSKENQKEGGACSSIQKCDSGAVCVIPHSQIQLCG